MDSHLFATLDVRVARVFAEQSVLMGNQTQQQQIEQLQQEQAKQAADVLLRQQQPGNDAAK
jgi:hypothetical protein